ncbi:hypothetical protein OUZ56_010521 [Daphnia magna]|uniref:Helicase ATP-binding domain-containing protein n=1 Tax=Daphnia magna TaxID=35525 RepID=A0ABR0AIY7_9CRUS|nr:hypothetical protein OUZ56_010521 [Daphnia magna]
MRTSKSDIYSFSMVIYELVHLEYQYPWASVYRMGKAESISTLIIEAVKRCERPQICEEVAGSSLANLMISMWDQNPNLKPDAAHIIAKIEQFMATDVPSDDVIQNASRLPIQNTSMFRPGAASPLKYAVAKRSSIINATRLEIPKRRLFADQGISSSVDETGRGDVAMTKSVPSGSDKHTDNLAVKSFEDNPSVQQKDVSAINSSGVKESSELIRATATTTSQNNDENRYDVYSSRPTVSCFEDNPSVQQKDVSAINSSVVEESSELIRATATTTSQNNDENRYDVYSSGPSEASTNLIAPAVITNTVNEYQHSSEQELVWQGYASKYLNAKFQLKPFQLEAIRTFKSKNDCIVIQATGSGKSTCFHIPALMLKDDQYGLVIVPTITLGENHLQTLQDIKIASAFFKSTTEQHDYKMAFDSSMKDAERTSVLIMMPEFLFGSKNHTGLIDRIESKRLSFIVIDESHLLFDWVSLTGLLTAELDS